MGGSGAQVRAVLVTVGDELLLGQTVDSNAAWLGRELAAMGIPVVRHYTVGDEVAAIQQAVEWGLDAGDLVVVSGGLGPTPDDMTRDAVADLLKRPVHIDAGLLDRLKARFAARGYELPRSNESQAKVPEGAEVLDNEVGTAPGLVFDTERGVVVLLPGPPRELKALFTGHVVRVLRRRFGDALPPVHHRVIHTTGIAESALTEEVESLLPANRGPVRIAYLPDLRGVDLRLTVSGLPEEEARAWLERVETAILPAVRPWRFDASSGDLAEAVLTLLRQRRMSLATAESCTGGLVAKRLTDHAGSSDVFVGGVVAYANELKVSELEVDPGVIERAGAVSEEVASAMAKGVAARLGAEAGIGVTGIAGPGGGTVEKPVGTVWMAAAIEGKVRTRLERFVGGRAAVRERAAQACLALLLRSVETMTEPPG